MLLEILFLAPAISFHGSIVASHISAASQVKFIIVRIASYPLQIKNLNAIVGVFTNDKA
jgi:hypothetical protein